MSDTQLDEPNLLEGLELEATEIEDEEVDAGEGEGDGQESDGGGQERHDAGAQEGRNREGVARRPANETIRNLRSERQRVEQQLRDEASRREALERQLAELRRPDPVHLAQQQQEENERVMMMQPHEVAQYYAQKTARDFQQQQVQFQRQQLDRLDQIEFRALVASNPVAKRFESQVEKLVRQEAAKGYSVTRETALKFALGEALLEKTKSAAGKQKPAGAARLAAQTTRTTRAGADVGSERARAAGVNALEKRLENMKL